MHFMQRYGKRIRVGFTVAAGLVLVAATLRPQMPSGVPPVGPVWEYASISGSETNTRLSVCYADTKGCRRESPDASSLPDSMMAAAARLGEKGWELAAISDSGDNRHDRTLYFKRLKSVLNKSDSR